MPERRQMLKSFRTRPRCCTEIVEFIVAVGGLTSSGFYMKFSCFLCALHIGWNIMVYLNFLNVSFQVIQSNYRTFKAMAFAMLPLGKCQKLVFRNDSKWFLRYHWDATVYHVHTPILNERRGIKKSSHQDIFTSILSQRNMHVCMPLVLPCTVCRLKADFL